MRSIKTLVTGLAVAMLLCTGVYAGSDLNEVGALLVFPTILAVPVNDPRLPVGFSGVETFVTITNAGPNDVVAHVSYINGDSENGLYCKECNFEIPLTGNDTETLVVTSGATGTHIVAEDLFLDLTCNWPYGMMIVALEDEAGNTLTDNVLLGEEVIVNYLAGNALSIPAIPFQGGTGNGDREYRFDDSEYGKLPRIVAADFLAPNLAHTHAEALLSLFTLGFERQFPPLVDCSVIGFDADEHPFSASFQFGCWDIVNLYDISPEFYFPNLGLFNNPPAGPVSDTHGWLQLNCRVDTNPAAFDGFEADGGVHGAILQGQGPGTTLPAGSGANFTTAASWGRLLYQSVTTGDEVTLIIESNPAGLD